MYPIHKIIKWFQSVCMYVCVKAISAQVCMCVVCVHTYRVIFEENLRNAQCHVKRFRCHANVLVVNVLEWRRPVVNTNSTAPNRTALLGGNLAEHIHT